MRRTRLKWRNLKVAELKAVLTLVQADTRGSKQALVDRCLDEDVAFEIKEQLLAACRGRGGEGEGGRARKVRQTPRMGRTPARMTLDVHPCITMYLGCCPAPKGWVVPALCRIQGRIVRGVRG
jgi:hypothetical protein